MASAETIRLEEGFAPHPLVTPLLEARMEKVSTSDKGIGNCGSSFTTAKPVLRFELPRGLSDLNILFTSKTGGQMTNAAVRFPNGNVQCAKHSNVHMAQWPKGHYEVYFFSSAYTASATLRFEQPTRLKNSVKKTLDTAPLIDMASAGEHNSQFVAIKESTAVPARIAGIHCPKADVQVMPAARLRVERSGYHFIASPNRKIFIERDGKCIHDGSNKHFKLSRQYSLKAGEYEIWTTAGPAFTLEIDERGLGLAFGKSSIKKLGPLDTPQLLAATTQMSQRWPTRAPKGCGGTSRKPDFYLHANVEMANAKLFLFGGSERFHIFGPIDSDARANRGRLQCDRHSYSFEKLLGYYAIWAKPGKGGPGKSYRLAAYRTDLETNPLTVLVPIPKNLRIAGRVYSHHYPFLARQGLGLLFEKGDERLFVYSKSNQQTIKKSEPLIVANVIDDKVLVHQVAGSKVWVSASSLSEKRPKTVALPKNPTFVTAIDYTTAKNSEMPNEKKLLGTYWQKVEKYRTCVGRYMDRDPTWGKGYKLVRVRGPHAGETLTDGLFRKAGKKCGERKLEREEKKLVKQINKARKKHATQFLRRVRDRFGV